METRAFLFAVVLCVLSYAAVVVSAGGYKEKSKPITDRLFEIAMAVNCGGIAGFGGNFPRSADSNKGPLGLHPKHGLTTEIKTFGVKTIIKQDPFGSKENPYHEFDNGKYKSVEYGPVGGFVLADASDGSITVAFSSGWDDVFVRLHGHQGKYQYPPSLLCERNCLNCATGRCVHCPIDRSFVAAYLTVRDDVYKIVDGFTDRGFDGPIFLTGYSLGGGLAVEAGLQMGVMNKYKYRCGAVYTFGTPKVFDKGCHAAIVSSPMGFFRVTWPGDYDILPESVDDLDNSVTTLLYEDLQTLKTCLDCKRVQLCKAIISADTAIDNAIHYAVIKPASLGLNLVCNAARLPLKLLPSSRRHCPEQTNILTYAPSCGKYLKQHPEQDLESGMYVPLLDGPANCTRASGSGTKKGL